MMVAIYARKSTEQSGVADDQKSVARQVEHARAYAAAKGWSVADEHVYVDDGISGAEFSKRPGFLRLMNALKPRAPFDVLIMSEESRLGREAIETAYALKQLLQAGVRVFFYLEDRERTLNTPIEKAMLSLQTMADEMEREKARQRTYDALLRRARHGQVTGGRVFGYNNMRLESGVTRVIAEHEAAIVRRIFERRAAGDGYAQIAKMLNAEGAPSPRPQQSRPAGWAPSSVREVLHRELYRGHVIWNRTRKRDNWGRKHAQSRPPHEWIQEDVPALRIISDALWTSAHARIASARSRYLSPRACTVGGRPPGHGVKFMLTGLLTCGCCGASLEARSRAHGRRRVYFYGCSAYHRRGTHVCANNLIVPLLNTETAIVGAVEVALFNVDALTAAVSVASARILARARPGGRAVALEAESAQVHRELERLAAAIAEGGALSPLLEAIRARRSRQDAIECELSDLRASMGTVPEMSEVRHRLEDLVEEHRRLLHDRAHAQDAQRLLQSLVTGRLTMHPMADRSGYRFTGSGTLWPLLQGVVPQNVASPPGFDVLWTPPIEGFVNRVAA